MPSEKLFRSLFFLSAMLAVVLAMLPEPPHLPIDRLGDKFEHMSAFAVLALTARLGWREAGSLRILERLSFLGALIEVFQAFPVLHRDCDPRDWIADTLAVAVALLLTRSFRRETGATGNGSS